MEPAKDWKEFQDNQLKLERYYEDHKKIQNDIGTVNKKLAELIKVQSDSIKEFSKDSSITPEQKLQLKSIKEGNAIKQKVLPNPGSFFLQLFMGSVNSIVFTGPPTRKMKFKQEYEEFKYHYTKVSAIFALFLFFFESRVLDTFYQLLLIYFYLVLAIRENILVGNGSNIKSWWINHHYISIAIATTFLTWPLSEAYLAFRPIFYIYALYAATVQVMQHRYQMARLYTYKALGKASEMDTANSDSGQIIVSGNIVFLMPFVFFGQFFQLYNGITLTKLGLKNYLDIKSLFNEWQPLLLGFGFFVVFFFNFYTTVIILIRKKSKK